MHKHGDIEFWKPEGRRIYSRPEAVVQARRIEDVVPALREIGRAVAQGLHAAGYLAYEAAPAFDPMLAAHPPGELPLLWFGLYEKPTCLHTDAPREGRYDVGAWTPLISRVAYMEAFAAIRTHLEQGDTYQVNYAYPMEALFSGDAHAWFGELCAAQQGRYHAYVNAGRHEILSASPELFFRRENERVTVRPMKGTIVRGRFLEEDHKQAKALEDSAKDRAENVMIVDLLRNDLGRIARSGTVRTESLFDLERYPTLWQMTSTISAETSAPLPDILGALFPSGSVTGAPKGRTMAIIRDLEPYPRGVYCGAIGWWAPDGTAEFNVAIRTVTLDKERGKARCHVGGGITWDSGEAAEYEETRTKARFLTQRAPAFALLESLLLEDGYFLLEEHLARLRRSAEYFGYALKIEEIRRALTKVPRSVPQKVRLFVEKDGVFRVEAGPVSPRRLVKLGFAKAAVDSNDRFLFHKTTVREAYTSALATRPDCDDLLLWNERNEITESTTANVVVTLSGEELTPPVDSGLLAGTFREHLLKQGLVKEALLTRADVLRADRVRLINSVRQWIDVALVE